MPIQVVIQIMQAQAMNVMKMNYSQAMTAVERKMRFPFVHITKQLLDTLQR